MSMRHAGWSLALLAVLAGATGCVAESEYNALARSNLVLQDQLDTAQADRVKSRTQIALLRQEVAQAREAEQAAVIRAQGLEQQLAAMQARRQIQGQTAAGNGATPDGAATQLAGSAAAQIEALREQVARLQRENASLQRQLSEIRTVLEGTRGRTNEARPAEPR